MKALQKMKIKGLEMEMRKAVVEKNTQLMPIQQKLEDEWNKVFIEDLNLIQALESLENTREYGLNEQGILYKWTCVDVKLLSHGNIEQLERYLIAEGFITLDVKNERFVVLMGEFIGIDADTGNIFWSNNYNQIEPIASGTEYSTIEERAAIINAYIGESRVYPPVVCVNIYGDVSLVDIPAI